jgi:putative tryptophan/tyrosine transport system substrate-binding protein
MKMRRREFIAGLAGAATWPVMARAQQNTMPVIGYFSGGTASDPLGARQYYHRGLAEIGYVEGRNVTIEYRWADGDNQRIPALISELVQRQVAVITLQNTTAAALFAKAATQSIPIVFVTGIDPIELGLVASLNRPGGNLTGVIILTADLTIGKRLQMLRELVPAATQIAFLVNPTNPASAAAEIRRGQSAATALGVDLQIVNATNSREIETAFLAVVERGSGALLVNDDAFLNTQRDQVVALAARHGVPALYPFREFVAAGGLMSYGPSLSEFFRIVGTYTGRILKGEKPADMPVQQVTKVEFAINLKTAKTLGLTIPETLVATADEVIQ